MVFGILQEESGFADSTSALDANHAVMKKASICSGLFKKRVQSYIFSCNLQSLNSKIFQKRLFFSISEYKLRAIDSERGKNGATGYSLNDTVAISIRPGY